MINAPRLLALVLSALASCTSMSKVEPGAVAVQEAMTVESNGAWNRFDGVDPAGTEVWTVDGLALDRLRFFAGIAEGKALGDLPDSDRRAPATFRADMSPHEIVELYEAYVTENASLFRLLALAPATFASRGGFRFEFELVRRMDRLPLRGVGYGAVHGERLYMMVYSAPATHYFARHLGAAEAAVRSARIVGYRPE